MEPALVHEFMMFSWVRSLCLLEILGIGEVACVHLGG